MPTAVELATGYVSLSSSARNLGKDISNQFAGVSRSADKAGKDAGRRFGSGFGATAKGLIAGAAVVGAAKAIGGFFTSGVKGASDLSETVNKSSVIFGKNASSIRTWSKTANTSLGLTQQEALAAAAGFGDMFSQIGFTADQAAKMSTATVQMSADIGSFNNLPTADVQERISAAFRGEYDSLQAVIPNINAARVEQEAMAATGKKNAKELTAQEKATAVLAIVQKDGARASGDFAKTQGGLANQGKIMAAQFSDIKTQIASAFIPALEAGAGVITKRIFPALSDFATYATTAIPSAFKAVKDALFPVTDTVDYFIRLVSGKEGTSAGRSLPWATTVIDAAFAIRGALTDVKYFVLDAFDTIRYSVLPVAKEIAVALGTGLRDNINQAMPTVKLIVGALGDFGRAAGPILLSALRGLADIAIKYVIPAITEFRSIIISFAAAAIPVIITGLRLLAGFIRDRVVPAVIAMVPIVKQVAATVIGFGRQAIPVIIGALRSVATFIRDEVVPRFLSIAGAVGSLVRVVLPIIKQVFGTIIGVIRENLPAIKSAFTSIGEIVRGVFSIIGEIVKRVMDVVKTNIDTVTKIIRIIWSRFGDNILGVIKAVFGTVIKVVSAALKVAAGIIKTVVAVIRGDWSGAWNGIKQIFSGVLDAIKAVAKGALNLLKALFGDILGKIRQGISDWANSVKTRWRDFWSGVRTNARDQINAIRTSISDTIARIRGNFSDFQGNVKSAWSTFWGAVRRKGSETIGNVRSDIKGGLDKLKGTISGFVSAAGRVWDGIKSKFRGPVDWVMDKVFNKIRSAYNKVAKLVSLPEIPAFSTGGEVGNPRANNRGSGGKAPSALADGGPVNRRAGGVIRGRGGPREDNIMGIDAKRKIQTAWVSAKEFVVNARAYRKNKRLVETINSGGDVESAMEARLNRRSQVQHLFLGGGVKPAAGSVSRHRGYGWAKWAGDINEPGAADVGHAVRAYKAGTIASLRSMTTSYGKHIRMNHAGNERTLYAHLSRFTAQVGQQVKAGQKIGEKGNTGNSSGPHLHFELSGGSNKVNAGDTGGGGIKGVIENVIAAIQPKALFTKAISKVLDGISSKIPEGDTPWGKIVAALPKKAIAGLKAKLPESYGAEPDGNSGSSKSSPNGNRGLGPRARAARAYVVKRWGITNIGGYANRNIAGTNTKSKHASGKAIDIMTYNNDLHRQISSEFVGNAGKWGTDNVITKRRIWNRRGWHGYRGIPHDNHVHVDFYRNGGEVGRKPVKLGDGGIVQGGRGGVLAHIGERRQDELVTPLPRNWKQDNRTTRQGSVTHVHNNFYITNPVAEPTSTTVSRVAGYAGVK